MQRIQTKITGFTLIELLIVVLIISILAAIAVPNFLEFQTRAKISRTKSDMRTFATALSAYRVDNDSLPEQGVPNGTGVFPFQSDVMKVYGGESYRHAAGNPPIAFRLSTPIAYVSSTLIFADPFFTNYEVNSTSVVNDTRYLNYSSDYVKGRIYDSTQDGAVASYLVRVKKLNDINQWHLRGRGPDNDYERRSQGWEEYLEFHGQAGAGPSTTGGIDILYDPTNGTLSNGDIVYFGAGGLKN